MQKDDVAIRVEHVHKSFNVFYDRTNTIKEKVLFWRRGKKEVRQI